MWAGQSAFIISHVFLAVANWALLTLVARTYSLAQTGEYNLALAALTPLFLFMSLQGRNRFLSDKRDLQSSFSDFLFSRALMIPAVLVAALGLYFFLNIPGDFYWAVFLLKLSESVFELPFAYGHKSEGAGKASLIQVFRVLGTYGFIVLSLYRSGSITESFIIGALFSVIFSLAMFHYNLKGVKTQFDFRWQKVLAYIKSSLPLGSAASILALNVALPRFFLDQVKGPDSVAIFSVSFAFYSIWQLFFNSYFNALLPHLTKLSKARKLAPLGPLAIFGGIMWAFSGDLYSYLFGDSYIYASSLDVGLVLSAFISFFSSYFYYDYLSRGVLSSHFKINVFAFILNLTALYPFIHFFGTAGAFYSWGLALSVQCLFYYHKKKTASNREVYAR